MGAENVEPAVVMLVDLPSLERGHQKMFTQIEAISRTTSSIFELKTLKFAMG